MTYAFRGLPALAFALHGWQRMKDDRTREDRIIDEIQEHDNGKQSIRERFKAMGRDFATEPIDFAWSANADATINPILNDASVDGVQIVSVECHSECCRLEINYDDPLSRIKFQGAVIKTAQSMSVLYFARKMF